MSDDQSRRDPHAAGAGPRFGPAGLCAAMALLVGACTAGERSFPPSPETGPLAASTVEALDAQLLEGESDAAILYCGDELAYEFGSASRSFNVASVRKSIVSALFGIASARGLVDLSMTLAEAGFDDPRHPLTDQEAEATIRDLLEARSGIYLPAHGESRSMRLRRPERGAHAPGTHFYYNNWDFNALGVLFESLAGLGLGEAFRDWIAEPTGMQDFHVGDVLYQDAAGDVGLPMYRFYLSARDLARFGLLYLHHGRWQDRQVIPRQWVEDTFRVYSPVPYGPFDGYGLLWWYKANSDSWWALGSGGQRLVVDAARGVVAVTMNDTGGKTRFSRLRYRMLSGPAPNWEAFSVYELALRDEGCAGPAALR